jgi:hypothetical protein
MNKRNLLLAGLAAAATSCKTTIEEAVPSAGSADFSRYVAMGSSFTAGVTNGALYDEGQDNSFPLILSRLFAAAGGGEFRQPAVHSSVGINLEGQARQELYLGSLCGQQGQLKARHVAAAGDQSIFTGNIAAGGPYHNLGIPGIRSTEFNDQFFVNPFFARFASTPGASSILSEAVSVSPSFFTLLIGQEDIYDYARNGGDDNLSSPVTQLAVFEDKVDELVNTLLAAGAQGAIANIPDPDDIPFFAAIPYNGLVLTAAQAQQLNQVFVNDTSIVFHEGANPYLVKDAAAPNGVRRLFGNELVLMNVTADSLCAGYGSYNASTGMAWPFADKHVLDQGELSHIRNNISAFNGKLAQVAQQHGLPYVDLHALFNDLNKGVLVNGAFYNNDYLTGRVYSVDGFHPTPQGYALIANLFVRAINQTYGATLRETDPNGYPGVKFP